MSTTYTYSPDGARVLECAQQAANGMFYFRRDWDGDAGLTFCEFHPTDDGAILWSWSDDTDLSGGPFLSEAQARADAAEFFRAARPCTVNGCGRLTLGGVCDCCL